tara:strand:- start:855 stop:1121 length:267 start_codon:yes stop_codon:yes gene_type:complete
MNFPADFPSIGVWQIKYFDENENRETVHTENVFVSGYLGEFYLLRDKTTYGWTHRRGERTRMVRKRDGNWAMPTWLSVIVITDAKKIN